MKLMKNRSFFVAGALLLASLFTTSCKELASNFDQPVKSYLTVNVADMTIPTGDTDTIKASSINSDKPITYKSSDESVAIVDENGVVTGVADGEAVITVSVEASENYLAGEQQVKVAVKRPLTFEALEDAWIGVAFNGTTLEKPIVYKKNNDAKVEITTDTWFPVEKGDKVEFESANERLTQQDWNWGVRIIASDGKCAVYGNVMSMISPDGNYHTNKTITQPFAFSGLLAGYDKWEEIPAGSGNWIQTGYYTVGHDKYKLLLPATTLTYGCYYDMFYNTGFTEAPELPATELADYCYQWMFESCGDLTKAPELPAKEMKEGCYGAMFYNTGLTEAPALPATTLANWCYQNMFKDCAKLTKAPSLPAAEMKESCYQWMFANCINLKNAPALPAETLADYCYGEMFRGCSALTAGPALPAKEMKPYCYQGLFNSCAKLTKAPAMSATKLAYGCYDGMFYNSGLTEAPALPVTDLAPYCYEWMFEECSDLTKAPALPATTLEEGCYYGMFCECESLEKAPDLNAETLVGYCYMYMFYNCTKLNYVKCLAKNSAYRSVYAMLWNAGTDESVTTRTLERDPDTYWDVIPTGYVTSYYLYVNEGWTITPPYSLEAPAAAPAKVSKTTPALEQVKDAPALGYSARQKAEMPARHQAPMNPEKPARFK